MTIIVSLEEWLAITSSLMIALSPIYWSAMRIEKQITRLSTIVEGCPYCSRNFEKEKKK
jgi:hypothetical protein